MRETNNKKLYKDTFDQISLSENAYRAIRNMEETNMNRKNRKWKTGYAIAVSLAALAVIFYSANGIAYAATGTSLIKRVADSDLMGQVLIYINGKPAGKSEINISQDKDGNPMYELHLKEDEDTVTIQEIPDTSSEDSRSKSGNINNQQEEKNNSTETVLKGVLKTETKKTTAEDGDKTDAIDKKQLVYLVVADQIKIDITYDFTEDGVAAGTFNMDGTNYEYLVEGTIKDYSINFSLAK